MDSTSKLGLLWWFLAFEVYYVLSKTTFFSLFGMSMGSWFALFHSSSFVILSCHLILRMFLRHLFEKVCILCIDALVVRQVSDAYSRTDLTLELKILSFVLFDISDDVHIGRKVLNTAAAFPILAFISLSVPPSLLTTLPR